MEDDTLSQEIREKAASLGIDVLGFAGVSEFEGYLLPDSRRRDLRLALPDARTILVTGSYIGGMLLPTWGAPHMGRTSRLYLIRVLRFRFFSAMCTWQWNIGSI